jgi:hypothetical protein
MRILSTLLGLGLMLLGIYFLGRNIFFTTQVSPYWWRGIAADASVLSLTGGIVGLFVLPRGSKFLGWLGVAIGILLVFVSSRAILSPTSLWQFFVAMISMVGGYQLLTTGRINV